MIRKNNGDGRLIQGKIIKGIAGFYYVRVVESGVYECKAKGIFRKDNQKPLVGDNVEIQVLDEKEKLGNLEVILPRQNELVRPAVANVDQALLVFAVKKPKPHFHLLDHFLVMLEQMGIPAILCFNKSDLSDREEKDELLERYRASSYPLVFASAKKEENIQELRQLLIGKTTTIAGPSPRRQRWRPAALAVRLTGEGIPPDTVSFSASRKTPLLWTPRVLAPFIRQIWKKRI